MQDLAHKKCVPCEGGMPPLTPDTIGDYKRMLQSQWEIIDDTDLPDDKSGKGKRIKQEFKLKNFKEAMDFVNKVAAIAESEGHHPDIFIYYNRVVIELWTHAVGGLSENDFIMARKIEMVLGK